MPWLAASTAFAEASTLNGLVKVPVPFVAAAELTNQITGPAMLKLAVAAALHWDAGVPSPLSQTVKLKLTLPVRPAAGSIVNAPVVALATTVPTPAMVVVIVPATGATPLTVPIVKVGLQPALPATSAASPAPASRPPAASSERCMFACSELAPKARPGEVGTSFTAVTVM